MFSYLLYRLGQFIVLLLPLKVSYVIAVVISDAHYLFAGEDRRAVSDNLRVIFPEKPEKEIAVIRRQLFRNFAKYLVDFFRFSMLNSGYIQKNVKIENLHYNDQALAKGKGVITLTAHLGNWELGGVVFSSFGYPVWAVALPHKEKKVNEFFNRQRESKGLRVIPLGNAARQCLRLLKENRIIALVGDRDFNNSGMVVDFFGRQAVFPQGPAAFCIKTGAPVVPGFMLRNPDDTFTLRFENPIERPSSGDDYQDELSVINQYKAVIEGYVRRYPDQWYMFRRFWIE